MRKLQESRLASASVSSANGPHCYAGSWFFQKRGRAKLAAIVLGKEFALGMDEVRKYVGQAEFGGPYATILR